MKTDYVKVFLMGVAVAILAVMAFGSGKSVRSDLLMAADSSASAGGLMVMSLTGDVFVVVDGVNRRMAVYDYSSSKIKLKAARNMEYDLKVNKDLSSRSGLNFDSVRKMATRKKK